MTSISNSEKQIFLEVLAKMRAIDPNDDEYIELERAVAHVIKTARKKRQVARRQARKAADRELDSKTSTFEQPISPSTRAEGTIGHRHSARNCYVCKELYFNIDSHYHQLCSRYAQRNRAERLRSADLRGHRAVVTGGRIKIGYHVALRLLRAGADVVLTTRFPVDAQHRFALEEDARTWIDRLHLIGADFLNPDDVEGLVDVVQRKWDHFDILVNNAAQTIARPQEYYRAVREAEGRPPPELAASLIQRPNLKQIDSHEIDTGLEILDYFTPGVVDETGEQIDLRPTNSWELRLHEVEPGEWISSHVVTAFVPWYLIKSFRPQLLASPEPRRFVVNVSAMEGAFTMPGKTSRHPHTNAAKAAMNMLTRTAGPEYANDKIFMTSVDTGWVTDERAHPNKMTHSAAGFRPPLDVIDGAARVTAPIFDGQRSGTPLAGVFVKDYEVAPW